MMAESVVHLKSIFIVLLLLVLLSCLIVYHTSSLRDTMNILLARTEEETRHHRLPNPRSFMPFQANFGNKLTKKHNINNSLGGLDKGNLNPIQIPSKSFMVEEHYTEKNTIQNVMAGFKRSNSDGCPDRQNISIEFNQIPNDLYKVAPQVLKQFPKNFTKGYNSPCWLEKDDASNQPRLWCLPKFFLAGVAKCGTTDIYQKICSHPQIISAREKEPSWWTRKRINGKSGRHKPVPFYSYLHEFDKLTRLIQDNNNVNRKLISGDGSPSTFWNNMYWRQYVPPSCKEGPTYVIADVLRSVLPQAKILAIFRNPTDRLYSDYMFTADKNSKRSPHTFHNDVVKSTAAFSKCLHSSGKTTRSCIYDKLDKLHTRSRPGHDQLAMLMKGLYAVHAHEWLLAYPRDQLMFIRFEDWYRKCHEILPVIYSFLEIDHLPVTKIDKICSKANPTKKKNRKGPMLNETRLVLNKFYQESRFALAHLMNDDRWLWREFT